MRHASVQAEYKNQMMQSGQKLFSIKLKCVTPINKKKKPFNAELNPYPTAFPYGNGMVLHFYQQQESSTTKTVHKVINKGLKTYV